MEKEEKIKLINEVLKEYFKTHDVQIQAKELMPMFIQKGIFSSNHRDGLPLRKLLRDLDNDGVLNRIPYVTVVRNKTNRNWYFAPINTKESNANVPSLEKINTTKATVPTKHKISTRKLSGRANSDEYYVIGLCNKVLGKTALQQHRFNFLVGDSGVKLPVDAYYPDLNLVVEYRERQHTESVKFFDNKNTVSGVPRGEQRRIYDQRRRDVLPKHGIDLIEISYSDFGTTKKLKRDEAHDLEIVKRLLSKYL